MMAQFLYNPPDKGLHCHCPSLLALGSGDLLATWYAYPEKESEGATLVLARKRSGEGEWRKSEGVLGPFHYSAGNPVLFETPEGTIWLLFVLLRGSYWDDAQLDGAYSEDGGRTWSQPATLRQERSMMVRHPPVPLADGSLLLPAYHEKKRLSLLLRSRSPYAKWEIAHWFEGVALIQPVLIREGSGRLSMFFRPWSDPRRIWRSQSGDEGRSWASPVQTKLPNPLSGIAAFMAGERIAVVYNHTEAHQRHPLSVAVSPDGGISWEEPWHIDTTPMEICYPSFAQDGDGRVFGLYTYNRRMIKFVSFNVDEIG